MQEKYGKITWAERMDKLENTIGYHFANREYLRTALTHSSFAKGGGANAAYNERIEFLGDAVLGLVVGEYIYTHYPDMPEGVMSRYRARLVCEEALFRAAGPIGLAVCLRLGHGEECLGGRETPSIVADAVESLIGAIYLDAGLDAARQFILAHVAMELSDGVPVTDKDFKTTLQETVAKQHGGTVTYALVAEEGPDHAKSFTMQVLVDGCPMGTGTGRTKQAAGQDAARNALKKLSGGNDASVTRDEQDGNDA